MSGYFYRGRHRAPSTTGATARRLLVSSGAAVLPVLGTPEAGAAEAPNWDAVAACESSGNTQASNGSHFGLYQFDLATWRSVGGTGDPRNASAAEQTARAQALYASRGMQPWDASRGCWAGKTVPVAKPRVAAPAPRKAAPQVPAARPAPVAQAPAQAVVGDSYVVRSGDTLSGIAARRGSSWQALWERNRATISNPDLIFPDQRLALS